MFEHRIRFSDFKKVNLRAWPNLGFILILLGFALILVAPIYREIVNTKPNPYVPREVIFDPVKPSKQFSLKDYKEEELPKRIFISSLGIDMAVAPSRVVDGFWEVSETLANFGLGSAPPGKSGNTVIFAHLRQGMFGNLYKIQKNAAIEIKTKDKTFVYKVSDIKEVSPSETSVIAPTIDKTLTLYTCSGFADSKRLVIQAKLVNKDSIE